MAYGALFFFSLPAALRAAAAVVAAVAGGAGLEPLSFLRDLVLGLALGMVCEEGNHGSHGVRIVSGQSG